LQSMYHDKEAGCLWYPHWLTTSYDHILRKTVLECASSTSYWKWLCNGQSQPWNFALSSTVNGSYCNKQCQGE